MNVASLSAVWTDSIAEEPAAAAGWLRSFRTWIENPGNTEHQAPQIVQAEY
jgi:hypothetical protein